MTCASRSKYTIYFSRRVLLPEVADYGLAELERNDKVVGDRLDGWDGLPFKDCKRKMYCGKSFDIMYLDGIFTHFNKQLITFKNIHRN